MKFVYTTKNGEINDLFKSYVEKKIGKMEKLLQGDITTYIRIEKKRDIHRIEINIKSDNLNIRAEVEDYNASAAVDKAEIILDGQIRKYKTKLEKKRKRRISAAKNCLALQETLGNAHEEEYEENEIVRTKKFAMKPMFPEDACLEMELMNHEFYMFFNAESEQVNVVYKRHNGGYGLIEPILA